MTQKKILVTGANGFIGRELCKSLSLDGADITQVVRKAVSSNERQFGNFSSETDWTQALHGCKVIFHLAARAHVLNEDLTDPLTAFRSINVDATTNLARQAAKMCVKRFIFISSIGVNGVETFSKPFSEETTPNPHSDYALSKLEAEEELIKICNNSNMEYVIVRPPLVYGPQAPGNFKRLLKIVNTGIPLPLGGINNKRSMVSLENIVNFLKLCGNSKEAANQIFLIADGQDVSISELINLLSRGMGKKARLFSIHPKILKVLSKIIGKEYMYTQLISSLQVDSSKAKSLLSWAPPIDSDRAIILTGKGYVCKKVF